MGQFMKVKNKITKEMDLESFLIRMEVIMKEIGLIIGIIFIKRMEGKGVLYFSNE